MEDDKADLRFRSIETRVKKVAKASEVRERGIQDRMNNIYAVFVQKGDVLQLPTSLSFYL